MSISIAGRIIPEQESLSSLCRLTLSFIDGGVQWLIWAIANPAACHDFPDETQLVVHVQQVLHTSPLTLLPTLQLMVSPAKLMSLTVADLRTLAKAETSGGDPVTDAMLRVVLAKHGLVTRNDLAAGVNFLVELGVASEPLFQTLDLNDTLEIHGLMGMPLDQNESEPLLKQEAASFAVMQARTPQEFCDYYRTYVSMAANPNPAALTISPSERSRRAEEAIETLSPLLLGALDCQQLNDFNSVGQVMQAVRDLFAQGGMLGFAGLSRAVQQVACHSTYMGETGAEAESVIQQYLHAAQAFIADNQACNAWMRQDETCFFRFESETMYAELQLERSGVLSLREFVAKRRSPE